MLDSNVQPDVTVEDTQQDQAANVDDKQSAGNVLTLKNRNQTKEYDLSDPEQVSKLRNLAQQGWRAGEKNDALAKKAQDADRWNSMLENAKTDEGAFNQVVGFIEQYTGKRLTPAQKQEVQDDLDSPFDNELKSLKDEIMDNIKNEFNKRDEKVKEDQLLTQKQQLEQQLLDMENDKKKYPHFDYDEIVEYANETGILDFNMLYNNLYLDKIIQDVKNSKKTDSESLQNKRERGFVEAGQDAIPPKKERKRSRNLEEAFESRINDLTSNGKSLFIKE